ncbi:MAG: hypothetical protein U0574_08410 [Phycisphaerales bacterium]
MLLSDIAPQRRTLTRTAAAALLAAASSAPWMPCTAGLSSARAETVTFNFENANVYSPLPVTLGAGSVSATFSGTGQGYSIQWANTMGFTPVGFSGKCIYPSSVFLADLVITFSKPLTAFSVLYAVQELDCDCSATMKVTAYLGAATVGSATKVAQPGFTWPTATLAYSAPSGQSFDKVVVHYQSPPPCGCDYGVIFMADNVQVTTAPAPTADLNADGHVNGADLGILLAGWGTPSGDLNADGTTNGADLGILLAAWTG